MNKGIDVSHWDKSINWSKVANDGIKFAFTKATEGATTQDETFKENFEGMKGNNISAGAYHVFRMTSTPEEQLQNIIYTLKQVNFDPKKDRLAISATTGICEPGKTEKCDDPKEHTNEERAENLHSLLTQLGKSGYSPIIYGRVDRRNFPTSPS